MKNAFYAMLNRLRLINRWSLMRNTGSENVMEHSYQTSCLAHALALIRLRLYPDSHPRIDPDRVLAYALYHDVSEIITGDMPTPIKYATAELRTAYAKAEERATARLLSMLPDELREDYRPFFDEKAANPNLDDETEAEIRRLVKTADQLSALIKCQEEVARGNNEFRIALEQTREKLKADKSPELHYFLEHFGDSFAMSLDELQENELQEH